MYQSFFSIERISFDQQKSFKAMHCNVYVSYFWLWSLAPSLLYLRNTCSASQQWKHIFDVWFNWRGNVHTQINRNALQWLIDKWHNAVWNFFGKWTKSKQMISVCRHSEWQQYIATMFLNMKITICLESHWHWTISHFKESNWHWIIVKIFNILNMHELSTFF